MTFIKGVKQGYHYSGGGQRTVTVVGFVCDGSEVRAVIIDSAGRFDTERLDALTLPPRQPIGGGYGRVDAD